MRRKLLAVFLVTAMVIQPLSVAGVAEFADGQQVNDEAA